MHYNAILLAIFAAGTVSIGAFPHNDPDLSNDQCIPLGSICPIVDPKDHSVPLNKTCCINDVPSTYVSLAVVSIHS